MAYTYILKTAKGTYYIGSTEDIKERLKMHRFGKVKSTKDKLPVELVFQEYHETRAEAQKKEYKIKSWKSRKMIEILISTMVPSSIG
ncbi:MAG: GIY-YIG nuclease family protein [Patescibacteria group bacterium]|nr:GIY-YIG nuclease family protein [Patescibacteria group bacterium]